MAIEGAVVAGPLVQGVNDPLAINETSDAEAYHELPDWTELYKQYGGNATELQLRSEYLREYRKHHENDPEVKYAVEIFYSILVCCLFPPPALLVSIPLLCHILSFMRWGSHPCLTSAPASCVQLTEHHLP